MPRRPTDVVQRRARRHERAASTVVDGRDEPWARVWQLLADMILSGEYRHVDAFLRSVQETIEQSGCVTPRQVAAIARIIDAERNPQHYWWTLFPKARPE